MICNVIYINEWLEKKHRKVSIELSYDPLSVWRVWLGFWLGKGIE